MTAATCSSGSALNATHRKVRSVPRVEHVLCRMRDFKILRDYRRTASTLADTLRVRVS